MGSSSVGTKKVLAIFVLSIEKNRSISQFLLFL